MARSVVGPGRAPRRPLTRVLTVVALSLLLLVGMLPAARAADALDPRITLIAEPLLGGGVRIGEWAAVRVHVENDGPAVDGQLRITTGAQGSATYAIPVQLATGARQEHELYGRTGFFGGRFTVDLIGDGLIRATARTQVEAIDPETLGVVVVAERPEALIADIRASSGARGGQAARVASVEPADLPSRVEAWGVVDRLVWQDVPSSRLTTDQLDALRTWLALGGELVILGGSAGAGVLEEFPDDLLPFRPEGILDVPVADLASLLDTIPVGATPLPALAGPLARGTAWGTSGDRAFAARMGHGQGSVTIVGIDPAAPWITGTSVASGLWRRALRPDAPRNADRGDEDDGTLMFALNYLPAVSVPPMDVLFLLFLAYVLLLGPVSYLVLRRLDRREWAWMTMPALAIIFTVAAFVLGLVLKGTTVVVNELAVVRGAAGADRGIADVHVGIFSPTRTSFDVAVPGGALVSESTEGQRQRDDLPFDVLLGEPARIRGFQVGFGSLRGFRVETGVVTPRLDADLRLVDDRLQGTVANGSEELLEQVAVVHAGGVQRLGDMAPGERREVDVTGATGGDIVRRLFADDTSEDADSARSLASRVAIVRHLTGERGWDERAEDRLSQEGPVLLAWRSAGVLDVDVGVAAERVGETLYLLPARAQVSGPVTFTGSAIRGIVVDQQMAGVAEDASGLYLERGTLTVDYHASGFDGTLAVSALELRLGLGPQIPLGDATDLAPLGDAEQPEQDDPLGTGPAPDPAAVGIRLPRVQLLDRTADRWVEMQPMIRGQTYRVVEPLRYVDTSGSFLVRFVRRDPGDGVSFALGARLSGVVR